MAVDLISWVFLPWELSIINRFCNGQRLTHFVYLAVTAFCRRYVKKDIMVLRV